MANPTAGSADAGSPNVPTPTTNNGGAPVGQTPPTGGAPADFEKAYGELESRFGTQGQELGEYRKFFQNISPLLDKLDQSPELVQAIVDGKLDQDIAKAVLEGRVDVKDAAVVQEAHEQVKEGLGKKAYAATSPEDISKMVEAQVSKFRQEFEEKSDLQNFQEYTQEFIKNTPDFKDYADQIDTWLDEHDVTDIEVAYYAVKGQMSEAAAQKAAEAASGERAKEVMANAGGGGPTAQFAADGTPLVDQLISGNPNPNYFLPGS
jgi:hypothetical protein